MRHYTAFATGKRACDTRFASFAGEHTGAHTTIAARKVSTSADTRYSRRGASATAPSSTRIFATDRASTAASSIRSLWSSTTCAARSREKSAALYATAPRWLVFGRRFISAMCAALTVIAERRPSSSGARSTRFSIRRPMTREGAKAWNRKILAACTTAVAVAQLVRAPDCDSGGSRVRDPSATPSETAPGKSPGPSTRKAQIRTVMRAEPLATIAY